MGIGSYHSKSLLGHDGLVHLSAIPTAKAFQGTLTPVVPWPRDLNLISDFSVLVFESLSFKYSALDLS